MMSERGTGRTWRQLAALPDGSVFLVATMPMISHGRALLRRMGRNHRSIRFVTPSTAFLVRGLAIPSFDVDHAYYDVVGLRGREAHDLVRASVRPLA